MPSFFFKWVAVVSLLLYIALLMAGLLLPFKLYDIQHPSFLPDTDAVNSVTHFVAFLPWMLIAFALIQGRLTRMLWFGLGVLAVVSLEVAQLWIPCRGFGWDDMLLGLAGLVCSYALFAHLESKKKGAA